MAGQRVAERRHLRLLNRHKGYSYTNPGGGGSGEFQRPERDRVLHAAHLRAGLEGAITDGAARGLRPTDPTPLTYELQPHALDMVQSLEKMQSGIQLLAVIEGAASIRATILLPADKKNIIDSVLNRYATELSAKSQRPKGQDLVENINEIRLASERDLWTDNLPFPEPPTKLCWEVWLHLANGVAPAETWQRFNALATQAGMYVKDRHVVFPDRVVVLAYGSFEQWEATPRLLLVVAELRAAKELTSDYVGAKASFQKELSNDLVGRLIPPAEAAPAVCLLDVGVSYHHPLLSPALREEDAQALKREWGAADNNGGQHGTTMAGVALYGTELTELLAGVGKVELKHRLESVKILPRGGENDPESYGSLTQEGIARAEVRAPDRNRVTCLTITAHERDGGIPSSWSAAIDQTCFGGEVFGERKLVCVAAGNLRIQIREKGFNYPLIKGAAAGVEDPGQAWNALTVGAVTDQVVLEDPTFDGYQPVAPAGDLSPTSRTSLAWSEDARDGWPLKPEIVMPGGNWAASPNGECDTPDELGLLTTALDPAGRLFTITRDTSPATAGAARLAAQITAAYPEMWPETVRALVVHSARWTPAMEKRFPGRTKADMQNRLRCYGYGQADLQRAIDNAQNVATLFFEGELIPFHKVGSNVKSNEMHVHELPWPVEVLQRMGQEQITMRVTLSYFVDPSPGRRGWTRRHRYASHGLRFSLQRKTETAESFVNRLSTSAFDGDAKPAEEDAGTSLPWHVGSKGRTQGSIHSDLWTGTAPELANCAHLAVYPVTGWWAERPHMKCWHKSARYSLIVSLESEETDIYSEISTVIVAPISISAAASWVR